MTDCNRKKPDDNSIVSNDSSTLKSVWIRLSHLFHTAEDSNRRLSTSSNESDSSTRSSCSLERRTQNRRKKRLADRYNHSTNTELGTSTLVLPPFSPTYCKANQFPYSNFYVKLPNGKWMIRYRSGNRDILGTEEFEGYMI